MTGPTTYGGGRRRVSDAVHESLRAAILQGELGAGDALPSERVLSEMFDVNRHAVREAIKRIQQSGLVVVAHGGATRVQDWRASCGLDLLADLGTLARADDRRELLRAAVEMRACVGADAARLCAGRADAPRRARLGVLSAADGDGTYDARLERYESFWEELLDGAGNVAYRLAFNTLVSARHGGIDAAIYAREVDDPAAIAALGEAAAGGDPAEAERLARALLDRTVAAVEEGAG